MRFGLFSVVDHYPAELPRTVGQFYDELLEQVEAAEALGFDSFWIAEHHFHEYGAVPSPPVWLAAAARRTRRIRLGAAVVVLPFRNPLLVAEEYAMVDVLSGGRLNLGTGSGYLRHEFEGFGVDPAEKRERFDEALEVLLRAWSGERFSYTGRFHRVSNVQLNVVPVQKPRPPIWIAVLRNEAAAEVGRRGYPVMMIPYAAAEQVSELAETVTAFRRAFVEAGGRPEDATVPFGLHTYVSDSFARATAEARAAMDRYVRTRLYARQRPYQTLVERDLIAFGSPEDVIRVARRYEAAGFTDYLAMMNFGGLEHARVLGSMERLARHVLPAFAS
ncbi:MAG: LLM class flavin-dependent oxidoreductase [Candidatus Rokubacteria bacterium]|jgi:alkanesulfonate monooxygenase SsuD/methylene tetrahydromethanopterin reductase-like flavin-dependent oxidoreductase (luciferase family)|nr:LLM class flavin-dependent oxidoreductase [Candidatus Rokubacteria bacterium]